MVLLRLEQQEDEHSAVKKSCMKPTPLYMAVLHTQHLEILKKQPSCWEEADGTALSVIAMQHTEHDYLKDDNFGASLVHNMVLIFSAVGANVYGLRDAEFEGKGSV